MCDVSLSLADLTRHVFMEMSYIWVFDILSINFLKKLWADQQMLN